MQIETRVEKLGASCTMFGIRVFLNWIEKDGQCWTLTDLVLIHVSNVVHFNPFFCDLIVVIIVVAWICLLDIFLFERIKGIDSLKIYFFQILKIVIEIWAEKFQCYARVLRVIIKYLFIFVSLFFISNVDPIRDKSYVFFKRYSKIYQIYRTTLRTEFKNWYLNVTKIVVEKKKRYLLVDVVQFNRRQRQHFDCWVNGQREKERGKWNGMHTKILVHFVRLMDRLCRERYK